MADKREKKPAGRARVDWSLIDPHWKAGILSVAELSRRFGVSRPGITKHYEEAGVERNLTPQIRDRATELVNRATAAGLDEVAPAAAPASQDAPTDAETVDVNARVQAAAILRHRRDVVAAQELTFELLHELRATTLDWPTFERLDQVMRKAGASGKVKEKDLPDLLATFRRVTSITSRIDNNKKLSETMKVLMELERKVLAIDDATPVDPGARVAEAVANGLDELRQRFNARLKK